MNIPLMTRQVAAGDLRAAAATLGAGEAPPAPAATDASRAERACRRGQHDEPVAIGLLMRYVAAATQQMAGLPAGRRPRLGMSVHIGRLRDGEMNAFLAEASGAPRVVPDDDAAGFRDTEARAEAARCLHCDCRKPVTCRLRQLAERYGARPGRYRGERRAFRQERTHPEVLYEPGKCIYCGLCIRICQRAGERLGLTYIGRGFDVRIGVPFDDSLAEGLQKVAEQCAVACPTAALAFRDDSRNQYEF